MAKQLNATDIVDSWKRGVQGSGEKYKKGIMAVTVNPMEEAAKKQDKYLRGVTEAANNGKWVRGLRGVSKTDWQTAATDYGATRLVDSANKGKGKLQKYLTEAIPAMQQLMTEIAAMPDATESDMEQRQLRWSRGMREFAKSRKS